MSQQQRLSHEDWNTVFPTIKLFVDALPSDLAKEIRRDPRILRSMIIAGQKRMYMIYNQFTRISEQCALLKRANKQFDWGFTEWDFHQIRSEYNKVSADREWPKDGCWVVVPYLDDGHGKLDIPRTFQDLWIIARRQHRGSTCHPTYNDDIRKMRIMGSEPPKPGLRLELIRFKDYSEHNWVCLYGVVVEPDKKPVPAHLGVLACLALHPNWIRNFKSCTDKVYVHGLQFEITEPDNPSPRFGLPAFSYNYDEQRLDIEGNNAAVILERMRTERPYKVC